MVRLPDSYQPNDRRRAIADAHAPRARLGLPDDAFVFCSFNNTFKFIAGQVADLRINK